MRKMGIDQIHIPIYSYRKISYTLRSISLHVVLLSMVSLVAGCSIDGMQRQQLDAQSPAVLLKTDMVADLLSVLPQILNPLKTTIQVSDTESGDTDVALPILVQLGYGVQRVQADQGSHFFYLSELVSPDEAKTGETRLRLSIGDIELTRSYQYVQQSQYLDSAYIVWRGERAVVPSSALIVAGTRQALELTGINVQIVQSDFRSENQPVSIAAGSIQYAALAPIEGGIPTISLITNDVIQGVAGSASAGPNLASLTSADGEFDNLFNGGISTFNSVLDDYNRVVREFIIFPNDSQNLGRSGKLRVKKLVSRFSENSDMVGIIGCSNGPTSLEIGNEGLALGRAKRIADELVAAGIPAEKLVNEGCWSSTTDADGFPNRGVVVDIWRRAG